MYAVMFAMNRILMLLFIWALLTLLYIYRSAAYMRLQVNDKGRL